MEEGMLTPEQIADGWIEHDGGGCPVDRDSETHVLFADGEIDLTYAGFWSAPFPNADDQWAWECSPEDRIIAYKPELTP
jgi:hypothetical protein